MGPTIVKMRAIEMKKTVFMATGLAAFLFNAGSPLAQHALSWSRADAVVHRIDNRDAAFAAGVALGVLGGIAASRPPRRDYDAYYEDRRYRRYRVHERRCARWRRMCRDGLDEGCWKYDTRC
jgi:hypothetical protein